MVGSIPSIGGKFPGASPTVWRQWGVRLSAAVLLLFFLATGSGVAQHRIIREVMGSGGQIMRSERHTLHGTVSQTSIGRLRRPTGDHHNVGFWYWAHPRTLLSYVMLPEVEAEPGDFVTIPLILVESRNLFLVTGGGEPRAFEARIRFNGSLLEPINGTPDCQWDGGECVLTITGQTDRSSGVIAEMDFLAKLGNAESTPLIIEEFHWLIDREVEVRKKDGEFRLLGICYEGGEIRLINSGVAARIRSWPNPASTSTMINYQTNELGHVRISLVDMLGREVRLFYEGEAEPDQQYVLEADLDRISSGTYQLVMKTPNEVLTQSFIVRQ